MTNVLTQSQRRPIQDRLLHSLRPEVQPAPTTSLPVLNFVADTQAARFYAEMFSGELDHERPELWYKAKERRQTVGELVRRAIANCYQTDLQGLEINQRRTLEAYRGGYVSIGKLAEVMGRSALDVRVWLKPYW